MLNHIVEYNPVTWLGNKLFSHFPLLSQISTYLSNLFINQPQNMTRKVLFALGVASLTYKLFHGVYNQYKFWNWVPGYIHNTRNFSPQAIKQKYGHCYVLITGAADGIGYAFSRQFAKMGFNLIMADIQEQKLLFKKFQILNTFQNIQVETFVVDMSNSQKTKEFVDKIVNFDIGIVINNVGVTGGGPYMQIDPKAIERTLSVNFLPAYEINKKLLPKLRQRNKRSAIINMSSATGYYISPSIGAYSSIKNALDLYSRTLAHQNQDKIDILSVRPFGVSTGMMKMRKQQRIITPRQCVMGVLTDLGHGDCTFPSQAHKFMGSFIGSLPEDQRFKLYQAAFLKNYQPPKK